VQGDSPLNIAFLANDAALLTALLDAGAAPAIGLALLPSDFRTAEQRDEVMALIESTPPSTRQAVLGDRLEYSEFMVAAGNMCQAAVNAQAIGWRPETHCAFPRAVREAIATVLVLARATKGAGGRFVYVYKDAGFAQLPTELLFTIFNFVAHEWPQG